MRLTFVALLVVTGCSRGATRSTPDDAHANPWSTAPVGSVYETRTVTRMQNPFVHQTESTTKQTLVARNEAEVSIKLEISEGAATSSQDVRIPLRQETVAAHDGSRTLKTDETCTVPAGTFECTKTAIELRHGEATRSTVTWTAKNIPVPVRSIVTNANMTITTELTSVGVVR